MACFKEFLRSRGFGWLASCLFLLSFLLCMMLTGCGSQQGAAAVSAPVSSEAAEPVRQEEAHHYVLKDLAKLEHTEIFAKGALEHIFDGEINKKGKATGYHYNRMEDSRGKILEGTRSGLDRNGVFTAQVEVDGVKKKGFSSFYPEGWTPQEVVDSIHRAYQDALKNPDNPRGSLWIGYDGNLEIDMYLNGERKIKTAYPVFRGK